MNTKAGLRARPKEDAVTRFQPPVPRPTPGDKGAAAVLGFPATKPQPLPTIRGLKEYRVVLDDGGLSEALPWPPGTKILITTVGDDVA